MEWLGPPWPYLSSLWRPVWHSKLAEAGGAEGRGAEGRGAAAGTAARHPRVAVPPLSVAGVGAGLTGHGTGARAPRTAGRPCDGHATHAEHACRTAGYTTRAGACVWPGPCGTRVGGTVTACEGRVARLGTRDTGGGVPGEKARTDARAGRAEMHRVHTRVLCVRVRHWLREHAHPCVLCAVSERAGCVGPSACRCVCVPVTSGSPCGGSSRQRHVSPGDRGPAWSRGSKAGLSTTGDSSSHGNPAEQHRRTGARGRTRRTCPRPAARPSCGLRMAGVPSGHPRTPRVLRGAQRRAPPTHSPASPNEAPGKSAGPHPGAAGGVAAAAR